MGELDARNVSLRTKGLVMNAWLGHEYLLTRPVVSLMMSTARKLRCVLPEVGEALRNGVIIADHAALLSKLCTPGLSPSWLRYKQIELVVDHPDYLEVTALSEATVAELATDLAD